MGTTKAGDLLEAAKGLREGKNIRELCPPCATKLVFECEGVTEEKRFELYAAVGW